MAVFLTRLEILLAVFAFVWVSRAADRSCDICRKAIGNESAYGVKDHVRNLTKVVCSVCVRAEHQCSLCGLPIVAKDFLDLDNGRVFCAEDSKGLILNDSQGEPLFNAVKMDLQRIFAQWLPVPDRNIVMKVLGHKAFINAHRDALHPVHDHAWLGLTTSRQVSGGGWEHQVFLLDGLQPSQFLAVAAHELTHVWLNEHGARTPALHPDAREGFCEFIAREVMLGRSAPDEVRRIEKNLYSRGQIDAFIKANGEYTFHPVVDWVLHGEDPYLNTEKLNRLLVLQKGVKPLQGTRPVQPVVSVPSTKSPVPAAVVPAPEGLVLKGITRAGRSSLALINNKTLGVGEEGKVRLGESNVTIRCISITGQSVVVQYVGSKEQIELALSGN